MLHSDPKRRPEEEYFDPSIYLSSYEGKFRYMVILSFVQAQHLPNLCDQCQLGIWILRTHFCWCNEGGTVKEWESPGLLHFRPQTQRPCSHCRTKAQQRTNAKPWSYAEDQRATIWSKVICTNILFWDRNVEAYVNSWWVICKLITINIIILVLFLLFLYTYVKLLLHFQIK